MADVGIAGREAIQYQEDLQGARVIRLVEAAAGGTEHDVFECLVGQTIAADVGVVGDEHG